MNLSKIVPGVLAVTLGSLALAACGSQSHGATSSTPSHAADHSASASPSASPVGSSSAVAAVAGSHDNEYKAGPFTVTMLPKPYDFQGQECPQVEIKNTSNGFTGWADVQVEFVKGHSVTGQVLDTENSTGETGTDSWQTLAPGQSVTDDDCPTTTYTGYMTYQMVSMTYGQPGDFSDPSKVAFSFSKTDQG